MATLLWKKREQLLEKEEAVTGWEGAGRLWAEGVGVTPSLTRARRANCRGVREVNSCEASDGQLCVSPVLRESETPKEKHSEAP